MIDITKEKLLELVASGESEHVEFKESFNDEAIEAIGAFANATGGALLIGIQNAGKITGFQIGKKTIEDIANRIQEATDPRLQPSISKINLDNKNIVIVQILPSTGTPISVRGRFFRRVGKTNQRMSHEEIMTRLVARIGLSWDAYIENSATLSDLNVDLIKQVVATIREKGRLPIPEHALDEDVLRKLELIKDGKITRAAILLFGKNPGSFFPSAFLKLGRFRSLTHIVDDREVHGTLIQQLDGATGWFRERLETEYVISGQPEREVRWEYPLKAIREAVINSLCHRDFNSLAHNQIRLYDDHLEIWNPGGLPSSLTTEALFHEHDSVPRNRRIADVFFYSGLIERWGSGTLRIVEELAAHHLPAPQFISEPGRFKVIFYKEIITDDYLKKLHLSKRQIDAVSYVKEHGSISNSEYQAITGVSKRTATRDLNILKEKGIFSMEGGIGRGSIYKLKGS
ncbi:MAG TPA: helix-turn-helix domain-containing protein [Candidatus Babeliales bacterium]|nr:helix-turn-helix domain-containing protein [Candidatus Babeliales bacterium]